MKISSATKYITAAVVMGVLCSSAAEAKDVSKQVIFDVRTTSYSTGPHHNGKYGPKNALGKPLRSGEVRSAAADWSKWPVGTRLRIVETGQEYIVDDYGSAMVGTGTIDLFSPRERDVWRWGVRHVDIEVIEWGCPWRSLKILSDRTKARHVREMVSSLKKQLSDG